LSKIIIVGIAGILLLSVAQAADINADSLFAQANNYYDNQQYDSALQVNLMLVKAGYQSASLYYNIGNCYFKQGELGYAILYYLRAKRLSPNDDDINANLAFAQQFMPTRLEGVKINPVTTFFDMIVTPFTMNLLFWMASILFIIFLLYLIGFVYFRYRGLFVNIVIYSLLILVIVSSGLAGYKYRTQYLTRRGVVVTPEAPIYSAPSENSDVEFTGGYGLTFEIKKSMEDYYLVLFENKRKGWIKKENIEII
jgi:tetratricopeptide (TPR) repeat protein